MATARLRPAPILALALAVGLTSCSLLGSEASSTTTAPVETTTTAPLVDAPVVEILEAGEPPRQLLRYALHANRSELLITTESSIRQTGASRRPIEIAVPPIEHRIELVIEEPDHEGSAFSLNILEATLPDTTGLGEAEAAAIEERLTALSGLSGTGTIAADGRLRGFAWSDLDTVDPSIRTGLDTVAAQLPGLVAPLPGAAVGSGARWRATSTVTFGGVPTTVSTVYELGDLTGSRAGYTSTSETSAEQQDPETLEDGSIARVLSSITTASGEGMLDLAGLLADLTVTSEAEQRIRIERGADVIEFDQRIESTVEITTVH